MSEMAGRWAERRALLLLNQSRLIERNFHLHLPPRKCKAAHHALTVAVVPGGSMVVNTASAVAGAPDPNLGNNSVTVVTKVFGSRHTKSLQANSNESPGSGRGYPPTSDAA
jgi:hypothetical protein